MKSIARQTLTTLIAPLALALTTPARATDVVSDVAPPPPRAERVAPREGYVWTPGYWEWSGRAYRWTSGGYVYERRGARWVAADWQADGEHWRFVPGHWER